MCCWSRGGLAMTWAPGKNYAQGPLQIVSWIGPTAPPPLLPGAIVFRCVLHKSIKFCIGKTRYMAGPQDFSAVILKMQFPFETNDKTPKFLQGTLRKSCFAGKKNWEALNVLLIKRKKNSCEPFDIKIWFFVLFLTHFSNDNVCELQNSECLKKAIITSTTLVLSF